ncbi:unnamed protein product [Closterium sp. Yama58-4]|nr:unnamed protein product [Closterium sp. Yama58-4]
MAPSSAASNGAVQEKGNYAAHEKANSVSSPDGSGFDGSPNSTKEPDKASAATSGLTDVASASGYHARRAAARSVAPPHPHPHPTEDIRPIQPRGPDGTRGFKYGRGKPLPGPNGVLVTGNSSAPPSTIGSPPQYVSVTGGGAGAYAGAGSALRRGGARGEAEKLAGEVERLVGEKDKVESELAEAKLEVQRLQHDLFVSRFEAEGLRRRQQTATGGGGGGDGADGERKGGKGSEVSGDGEGEGEDGEDKEGSKELKHSLSEARMEIVRLEHELFTLRFDAEKQRVLAEEAAAGAGGTEGGAVGGAGGGTKKVSSTRDLGGAGADASAEGLAQRLARAEEALEESRSEASRLQHELFEAKFEVEKLRSAQADGRADSAQADGRAAVDKALRDGKGRGVGKGGKEGEEKENEEDEVEESLAELEAVVAREGCRLCVRLLAAFSGAKRRAEAAERLIGQDRAELEGLRNGRDEVRAAAASAAAALAAASAAGQEAAERERQNWERAEEAERMQAASNSSAAAAIAAAVAEAGALRARCAELEGQASAASSEAAAAKEHLKQVAMAISERSLHRAATVAGVAGQDEHPALQPFGAAQGAPGSGLWGAGDVEHSSMGRDARRDFGQEIGVGGGAGAQGAQGAQGHQLWDPSALDPAISAFSSSSRPPPFAAAHPPPLPGQSLDLHLQQQQQQQQQFSSRLGFGGLPPHMSPPPHRQHPGALPPGDAAMHAFLSEAQGPPGQSAPLGAQFPPPSGFALGGRIPSPAPSGAMGFAPSSGGMVADAVAPPPPPPLNSWAAGGAGSGLWGGF